MAKGRLPTEKKMGKGWQFYKNSLLHHTVWVKCLIPEFFIRPVLCIQYTNGPNLLDTLTKNNTILMIYYCKSNKLYAYAFALPPLLFEKSLKNHSYVISAGKMAESLKIFFTHSCAHSALHTIQNQNGRK